MSKLIVDIPNELHKELKIMAVELGTTLRIVVISILAITELNKSDAK